MFIRFFFDRLLFVTVCCRSVIIKKYTDSFGQRIDFMVYSCCGMLCSIELNHNMFFMYQCHVRFVIQLTVFISLTTTHIRCLQPAAYLVTYCCYLTLHITTFRQTVFRVTSMLRKHRL